MIPDLCGLAHRMYRLLAPHFDDRYLIKKDYITNPEGKLVKVGVQMVYADVESHGDLDVEKMEILELADEENANPDTPEFRIRNYTFKKPAILVESANDQPYDDLGTLSGFSGIYNDIRVPSFGWINPDIGPQQNSLDWYLNQAKRDSRWWRYIPTLKEIAGIGGNFKVELKELYRSEIKYQMPNENVEFLFRGNYQWQPSNDQIYWWHSSKAGRVIEGENEILIDSGSNPGEYSYVEQKYNLRAGEFMGLNPKLDLTDPLPKEGAYGYNYKVLMPAAGIYFSGMHYNKYSTSENAPAPETFIELKSYDSMAFIIRSLYDDDNSQAPYGTGYASAYLKWRRVIQYSTSKTETDSYLIMGSINGPEDGPEPNKVLGGFIDKVPPHLANILANGPKVDGLMTERNLTRDGDQYYLTYTTYVPFKNSTENDRNVIMERQFKLPPHLCIELLDAEIKAKIEAGASTASTESR